MPNCLSKGFSDIIEARLWVENFVECSKPRQVTEDKQEAKAS